MTIRDLKKSAIPEAPGVYLFRGARQKVLYVGKATSLRSRVRSYFAADIAAVRSPLIARMVAEAKRVDYEQTDSVLEALILEANLIKKHQPVYNSKEKDDKSFNYVLVTNEAFPRLLSVRGKDLERTLHAMPAQALYGPFPKGAQFKEALRLIRKIFPYFDTPYPLENLAPVQQKKLYFNQQIGVFPGMPGRPLDRRDYARTIKHLRLFFEGKKQALKRELEREMKAYAKAQEFEKAADRRRKLFALSHIQDVSLIKEELRDPAGAAGFRIEAYDIAHTSGTRTTGVMVAVEDGAAQKSAYRKFKLSKDANNDTAALREVLSRRLAHPEWPYPKLVVVDGGKAQINAATGVLRELGYEIPVVGVVKDERHRPKGIAGDRGLIKDYETSIILANSEAHRFALGYHRALRGKIG